MAKRKTAKKKQAKPKVGKKRGRGVNSKLPAYELARRRKDVSRLLLSGYNVSQICHKLNVSRPAIDKDIVELTEQWYWRTHVNIDKWIREEIAQLLQVREHAWQAYFEMCNRHGESHQNGYLATVLNATKQLHELLRLNDPTANAGNLAPEEDTQIIEVTVRTREQAALIQSGSINFEDQQVLLGHGEDTSDDDHDGDTG